MDACTEQADGFRFLYVLPFTRQHLLVEDTCFSDDPRIDEQAFLARIRQLLGITRRHILESCQAGAGLLANALHPCRDA